MTDRSDPYRIALIDRPWLGYRSVMLATPLAAPPIERIRAVLAEFLVRHPTAPLACRIDPAARRWVPVPPAERAVHLERILRSAPDPDPDDLGAHVRAHRDAGIEDLPFVATVSPGSVMLNGAHVLGDAATLARLLQALAGADPEGLVAIDDRARTAEPVRALARGMRAHGRDWVHHLRNPSTPPPPSLDAPTGPVRPAFVGTVLDQTALRALTRWRNANAKGVSLTSVLTTAAFRALTAHGVPVHGDGFYALIDIRRCSPPRACTSATWPRACTCPPT